MAFGYMKLLRTYFVYLYGYEAAVGIVCKFDVKQLHPKALNLYVGCFMFWKPRK